LDPFHTCTDEQIWKALERVWLAETVKQLDGQLGNKNKST
jgi:hypothetical protein